MAAALDKLHGRLMAMKEDIGDILGRLISVKEEVRLAERERDKALEERDKALEELSAKRQEVADTKGLLTGNKHAVHDNRLDEKVSLDVGGRRFTMCRSTLSQFEDSVLAAVVSNRWSGDLHAPDGAIFLDMDPDGFEEVACFLRARRIDPDSLSSFSIRAVGLASYLGIPIDHVSGSKTKVAQFAQVSGRRQHGLVFGVMLPHPSCGMVDALEFRIEAPTPCVLYTKVGGFEESLTSPQDWSQAWSGVLPCGWNSIPLNLHLRNGEVHSIYLFCSEDALQYSTEAPASLENEPLILTSGRAVRGRFQWPHQGDYANLNTQPRYFAGDVKYRHYTAVQHGSR